MTNIEKIRQMKAEELAMEMYHCLSDCRFCPAENVCNNPENSCYENCRRWLEMEASE